MSEVDEEGRFAVITNYEQYLFEVQVFYAMSDMGECDYSGNTSDGGCFTDAWNNQQWMLADYEHDQGVNNIFVGELTKEQVL